MNFLNVVIFSQKSSFKVKLKPTIPSITVWKNMTVKELAGAMEKDLGTVKKIHFNDSSRRNTFGLIRSRLRSHAVR